MSCPCCNQTGYREVEIPVFVDGGYSDVAQLSAPCACNPEPTDADVPNWLDDPDFIIEDASVLYVPKPGFDDSGYPGETPDVPEWVHEDINDGYAPGHRFNDAKYAGI